MRLYSEKPIGVIYSHEEQFNPLFRQLQKSGLSYKIIEPSNQYFNPAQTEIPFSLIVNDMSSPPYQKRPSGITEDFLLHVEGLLLSPGVINGSRIANIFTRKTRQLSLLTSLGIPFPKTFVASSAEQFLKAIHHVKFPILVYRNEDPSVRLRFDSEEELIATFIQDTIDFDNKTLVVQEFIPAKGNHVVHVETLNGRFLQAVKVFTAGESREGWELEARIEAFTPPHTVITAIEEIARKSQMDIGRVAYVTDRRSNEIMFLGIQPHTSSYSQPVEGARCDLNAHLVGYIEHRLRKIREIELAI